MNRSSLSCIFMNPLILATFLISVSVWPGLASGQAACAAVVAANVEVTRGELSLEDLLPRSACPALLRAASRVHLGKAPLPGSVRVLEGNQIRAWLNPITAKVESDLGESANVRVPERVSVRLAGSRAHCSDLVARIFASRPADSDLSGSRLRGVPEADAVAALPLESDCGAVGRISLEAPFQLTKKIWNPALAAWDVYARCLNPGDCVPFRVQVPSRDFPPETVGPMRIAVPASFTQTSVAAAHEAPLVRPGERVSLLWDQDGIRLLVPAVSLDAGSAGAEVRARLGRGSRVVRAIVVSAGNLRAVS